jgi:hypothetical protein
MRFYLAILGAFLVSGLSVSAVRADSQVSPRDNQSWGASNSGQDMLQMTHDPNIVSQDQGHDPKEAQIANICQTVNGDYYREGEQGYDACMTAKRKADAVKTSASAPAASGAAKDLGSSKGF